MDTTKSNLLPKNALKPKRRVWSLDFAKGFALIFVVIIHILDNLSSQEVLDTPIAYGIFVFGRLVGSVVFMFLMGVALSISSRANLKGGIKRGLEVMLIGYVLNFLRGTLPVWLSLQSGKYTLAEIEPYTPLYLLREFDILPFAGLALIILATIRHFFKKPLHWMVIGMIVLLITPFLRKISTDIPIIDFFTSHIWGTEKPIYFPLLPWLAYPIIGMIYGHYLIDAKNKTLFTWRSVGIGIILMAITTPMLFIDPQYASLALHETFFTFRNTAIGAVWYMGFVSLWMGFCFFLVENIPDNILFRRFYYWSKNVTTFYCIQWIIIGWIIIDSSKISFFTTFFLVLLIIFAADRLTALWNRMTLNKK